jgi:hypothetical protein
MKRSDTFMIGITAFVGANCITYFVLSPAPYVTGWGIRPGCHDFFEVVGFPFVMLSILNESRCFSLISCFGNLVVGLVVSYFFARRLAHRLPPFWIGQHRTCRCSLCELLVVITVICLFLGVGMAGPGCGLVVRNLVCLAAPLVIYAWLLYRRNVNWAWLAISVVGLTVLALLMDYRYEEPMFFADRIKGALLSLVGAGGQGRATGWGYTVPPFVALTIFRAVVPIYGLMSLLVIAHVGFNILSPHRKESWRKAKEWISRMRSWGC